ncbi:MAG: hypothetical protein IJI57_14040 [Flexilinea sp.]|nr:hypothetical protein [Flexilinea sp.]
MVTEKQRKELLEIKNELDSHWECLMDGPILQFEFDEIDMIEAKISMLCCVLRILGIDYSKN